MPKVAILTATANRDKNLAAYFQSIVNADQFILVEIIVLINDQGLSSEKIIVDYARRFPNIKFLKSPRVPRAEARNILLRHSKAEAVYFLDDDTMVRKNTFTVLLDCLERYPEVDIFGGPNITPSDSSLLQLAQGWALGSFFGTLWMSGRYNPRGKVRKADSRSLALCNMAFRSKIFEERNILFNASLLSAEENLLMKELLRSKHKALYIPELAVYHQRRLAYVDFCAQIFTYGRGRAQLIRLSLFSGIEKEDLFYFFPVGFVFYILSLPVYRQFFYVLPFYLYLFLCLLSSLGIALREKDIKPVWILPFIYPSLHFLYGLGLFVGFCNPIIAQQVNKAEIPAMDTSE